MTTILSGDSRESVVEKIHNHLIEIGEQVRDNKIPMEDYLVTKVHMYCTHISSFLEEKS